MINERQASFVSMGRVSTVWPAHPQSHSEASSQLKREAEAKVSGFATALCARIARLTRAETKTLIVPDASLVLLVGAGIRAGGG
eukprot:scaffold99010_cov30-Prasinocladus_malaysianus.AAC.1